MRNWRRACGAFAMRLLQARRGNVAMIFALSLPPLLLMTLGGVDIHRASTVRVNLQDALDAATLAAARSKFTDDVDIQRVGLAALKANLAGYSDVQLLEAETQFTLNDEQVVVADAKVNVKTLVANIVLPPYGQFMDDYLPVGAHSEVNRSSKNVEVALVLDITGSMNNGKIDQLKSAANELVDIVVQDLQTPFYSKMSVVPYSVGVNVGTHATVARGAPVQSVNVTSATWKSGLAKAVSKVTRNSQATVTANGHGFQNGDYVWLTGIRNMSGINNRVWQVSNRDANTFKLKYPGTNTYLSTTNYSKQGSGGEAQECLVSDCSIVITANGHGLASGDYVYLTDFSGLDALDNDDPDVENRGYQVANATTSTYSIGVLGPNYTAYSSGGKSWCGQDRCEWRVFRNTSNTIRWLRTSTCVSERAGDEAYTDAYVSGAKVGTNYPQSGNTCPEDRIMPLSSSKADIKSLINGLEIGGSTAGQIGAAWGWYTVAPTFNTLWPDSAAGPYDDDILKAVILMTDGEFNTPYCSGVIGQGAGSGSGDASYHINCDATNGDPFAQTQRLCDGMKEKGILVYTVGFQVASTGQAASLMRNCATSAEHAFLPASGADLTEAFKAIGRDITRLRISK